MKRGTASRVILGKNTIAEMPGGVFVGTDVILGKKDGLTNDFNGLVLSNTVMFGKKVSHAAIISVIVRGANRIVLPDAIANSLQYVKAFGGTEQNGTPTPDAPVDIVSNNGVLKAGNIYNFATNSALFDPNNGRGWYIDGTSNILTRGASANNTTWAIPCKPNTDYTISYVKGNISNNILRLGWITSPDLSFVNTGTAQPCTFTRGVEDETHFTATIKTGSQATYIVAQVASAAYYQGDIRSALNLIIGNTIGSIYTDGTVETINAHGKNLFDISTIQDGYSFNASGQVVANSNYAVSAFISVKTGTYTFSQKRNFSGTGDAMSVWGFAADGSVVRRLAYADGTACELQTFEVQQDVVYIRTAYRQRTSTEVQIELGSTATEYAPYYNGGTATAEMLLKVGNYQDVQQILSGVVTRNVGVKVLDGTENWRKTSASSLYCSLTKTDASGFPNAVTTASGVICSHADGTKYDIAGSCSFGSNNFNFNYQNSTTDLSSFKQFLADQYNAGTPVIVIYPLATPTTESVAGQPLQVTGGDNVLEITQASLTGLELEAQYNTLVQLTVQEVENANLDNDVTVTIL